MKTIQQVLFSIIVITSLISCGGGGDSDDNKSSPPQAIKNTISITTVSELAIEKSNQLAKFEIKRAGDISQPLTIHYQLSGDTDNTQGSASSSDYQLAYSDGGLVAESLTFKANQNSRVIEVQPISDNLHEVPETLTITLASSALYQISSQNSAAIRIIDADNTRENAKVFLGTFSAQGSAITNGSGVLSFILQGDNQQGLLNYNISNLSTLQTDQHIHLAPSGTVIKDIEEKGNINNYTWDLSPGGIFVTKQQMLDALFNGEFFINIHTANYPHGEISAQLNFHQNVEPPEQTALTVDDVDSDIIRFLNQATFGATPEDYLTLREQINDDGLNRIQVYDAWLEQQFTLPTTSLLALTDALVPLFPEENKWQIRQDNFWLLALYAKDQLRQRMAFALSEILVIGDQVVTIRNAHRGTAHYWDMLANNAFGSYQKTLFDVAKHPIMGFWLSHLKNQKENLALGYYPDENFAREIMQLFSFGLVQRELNGTIKLGADNLPIATYDNSVIQNLARVFTGLSFSVKNDNGIQTDNSNFQLSNGVNEYQYRWTEPMRFFAEQHEFGEKVLFTDQGNTLTITENAEQSEAAAEQELNTVINAMVAHSSAAPFISHKLIQRFVTSNPSADYIARVAGAFGTSGDLKATIKAILLDPEARNPNTRQSTTFGKMKEPIIHMASILRLFDASSAIPLTANNNGINLSATLLTSLDSDASLLRIGDLNLGQRALGSASVFNFFLPDFSPTGELSKSSLVAPELQIMTESQLFNLFNTYNTLLTNGFKRRKVEEQNQYNAEQFIVKLRPESFDKLWQNTAGSNEDKATAVVNYLDFYLNASQLKSSENQITRENLINTIASMDDNNRFADTLFTFATMPELQIQK